jgi:carbon monoxide dehydrogenase subunit G
MELKGEHRIGVARLRVWQGLNDPALLAQITPGCESLRRWEDENVCGFEGTLTQPIGPLTARLTGKSTMIERVPPARCTLSGTADAGEHGSLTGDVEITLEEIDADTTLIRYGGTIALHGKLAALDRWLIEQTAQAFAETFCARLSKTLAHPLEPAASFAYPPPREHGLRPRIWVLGFVAVTLLLVAASAIM